MRQLQAKQTLETGLVLDGKYRVLEELTETADLRVWAGLHTQTARQVELHFLPKGAVAKGPEAERMLRAARAAGRAPHPNLLNVLDSGTDPRGRPFVVYERFDSESVEERVLRTGPLGLNLTGLVMSQLLMGLDVVHKRGVVHRYLRPENVLIERVDADAMPRVKISGFEYALSPHKSAGRESPVVPELPRGFSRFLAPEIRRGEPASTPSMDIYAAGVLMRFLLTGDTDPQREVGAIAARTIEHATADDPEERFLSAETFGSAVGLLLPENDRASLPPVDSLMADLKYMQQRRARESGICEMPTGEGRLELIPVLLMIEAVYARAGETGWERVVREVPEVESLLPQAGGREALVEHGVPMELVSRLLAAADRVDGRGDLRTLADIGQALTKRGLARFCSDLPDLLSPHGLIDCVPAIWSSMSRHGEVVVLERNPQGARIAVRAQVEPSLELCAVLAGMLRAQLRAVVAEAEVNTVACQALGDAADIFVLTWSQS